MGISSPKKRTRAVNLRKRGFSYNQIMGGLGIPKSTLSGWLENVTLSDKQKAVLNKRKNEGLKKARILAIKWHRTQKENRLLIAKQGADKVLDALNLRDQNIVELALAMLYLGEGNKSSDDTGMGNSDPLILRPFVKMLIAHYQIPKNKIRCELYLRADQNSDEIKRFWSRTLKLPIENFKSVHHDKRTRGSKTRPNYKGVCSVRCGSVAIKRKLLNISRGFWERTFKYS